MTVDFEKSWPARIGAHGCSDAQQNVQLSHLFRRVISKVFDQRSLLGYAHYFGSRAHLSYATLTYKDVKRAELFHLIFIPFTDDVSWTTCIKRRQPRVGGPCRFIAESRVLVRGLTHCARCVMQ